MAKPELKEVEDAFYTMTLALMDYKDNTGAPDAAGFYIDYERKHKKYKALHEAYLDG